MYAEGIHRGIKDGVSPDKSPLAEAAVPLMAIPIPEYLGDHPDEADIAAIRLVSAEMFRFISTCFNCRSSAIRD